MTNLILFNSGQAAGYFILQKIGQSMQDAAKAKIINYSWLQGHLEDIGVLGTVTAAGLTVAKLFFNDNKYARLASVFVPPILATIDELKILNLNPKTTTYDPQDIASFFAGSLLAYGLSKANDEGVFKKMFKKKSLEGTIEAGKRQKNY